MHHMALQFPHPKQSKKKKQITSTTPKPLAYWSTQLTLLSIRSVPLSSFMWDSTQSTSSHTPLEHSLYLTHPTQHLTRDILYLPSKVLEDYSLIGLCFPALALLGLVLPVGEGVVNASAASFSASFCRSSLSTSASALAALTICITLIQFLNAQMGKVMKARR